MNPSSSPTAGSSTASRSTASAVIGCVLGAALYAAAVAMAAVVSAAVSTAVDQLLEAGEITGSHVAADILGFSAADVLIALVVVDAVVILIHGRQLTRPWPASSPAAVPGSLFLWLMLFAFGLQTALVAVHQWFSLGIGWFGVTLPALSELPVEALLLAALLHPLASELLFRGTMVRRLEEAGAPRAVVVFLPAVLFALVQPSLGLMLVGFAFGVAAGLVYRRTGSLGLVIAAHTMLLVAAVIAARLIADAARTDFAIAVYAVIGALAALYAGRVIWRALRRPGPAPLGSETA